MRAITGPGAIPVTPGSSVGRSRHGGPEAGGHSAEATPRGADYLVIGRQVTRAADPRGEMLRILDEISTAAKILTLI